VKLAERIFKYRADMPASHGLDLWPLDVIVDTPGALEDCPFRLVRRSVARQLLEPGYWRQIPELDRDLEAEIRAITADLLPGLSRIRAIHEPFLEVMKGSLPSLPSFITSFSDPFVVALRTSVPYWGWETLWHGVQVHDLTADGPFPAPELREFGPSAGGALIVALQSVPDHGLVLVAGPFWRLTGNGRDFTGRQRLAEQLTGAVIPAVGSLDRWLRLAS
jgi:hypothetical protein